MNSPILRYPIPEDNLKVLNWLVDKHGIATMLKFIANLDPYGFNELRAGYLEIICAFRWSDTREGYSFWRTICQEYDAEHGNDSDLTRVYEEYEDYD